MQMFIGSLILLLGLVLVGTCTYVCAEETFKLVVTNSCLPFPLHRHAAVYDGQDSIFVLGGRHMDASYSNEIVKYSLRSGSVQVVARLPHRLYGVSAVPMGEHVVSFGGNGYPDGGGMTSTGNITRYTPSTGALTVVGNLPQEVYNSAAVVATTNIIAYVFGGRLDENDPIFWYNFGTNEVRKVAEYPRRYLATAVWHTPTAVAYIIGGTSAANVTSREILAFETSTGSVIELEARFPYDVDSPCAVIAHDLVYVIYGHQLLRYNPLVLNRVEAFDVEGWTGRLSEVACTYVPDLNRIYILGGYINTLLAYQIMYIDLDGSNTTPGPTNKPEPTTTEEAHGGASRRGMLAREAILLALAIAVRIAL